MKFRSHPFQLLLIVIGSAVLAESCSTPRLAQRDAPKTHSKGQGGLVSQIGRASWYGKRFQGRRTASGESFDMNQFTCAHPSIPFGTKVRITNLSNGKTVIVTVTDRGPYTGGRIVDVSYGAAKALDFISVGIARVKLEALTE